jgi:transcriptional regulator with XRE-family HTH domain
MKRRRHRFVRARKAAGHTQESLAEILRLDRSTVVRWERAENEPTPWIRPRLAKALGVTPAHLSELLDDDVADDHRRVAALQQAPLYSHDELAKEVAPLPARRRQRTLTLDEIDELQADLREQWHLLVRTDNLFGPRYALAGVQLQLQLIQDLLPSMRAQARAEFIKLAAQYAESAAWLHEDGGDLPAAQIYNSRAMAWAHEAGYGQMLAWTLFRRSQQAAYQGDAASVIGLSQAARRD